MDRCGKLADLDNKRVSSADTPLVSTQDRAGVAPSIHHNITLK